MNKQQTQNCRWKVFNRGALRLCGGLDILKIDKNSTWFIVFHVSILGSWSFIWELSPPKPPPWRRDWTYCGQKLN